MQFLTIIFYTCIIFPSTISAGNISTKHDSDSHLIFCEDGEEFEKQYEKIKTLQTISTVPPVTHSNVYVYEERSSGSRIVVKHSSEQNRFDAEVKFYEKCNKQYRTWPSYLPAYFGIIKNFKSSEKWRSYWHSLLDINTYTESTEIPTEAIALEFIDQPHRTLLPTKENFEKLTTNPANKDMCYRSLKIVDEINHTLQVTLNDRERSKNFLADLDSGDIKLLNFHGHTHQTKIFPISENLNDDELLALANNALKKNRLWGSSCPARIFPFEFEDTDYNGILKLFNKFSKHQPFAWHDCQIL